MYNNDTDNKLMKDYGCVAFATHDKAVSQIIIDLMGLTNKNKHGINSVSKTVAEAKGWLR